MHRRPGSYDVNQERLGQSHACTPSIDPEETYSRPLVSSHTIHTYTTHTSLNAADYAEAVLDI